jgi:hypothetical protein
MTGSTQLKSPGNFGDSGDFGNPWQFRDPAHTTKKDLDDLPSRP